MRLKTVFALAAAVLALGLAAPKPAEASGWHRKGEHSGCERHRTVRGCAYQSRHRHVYHRRSVEDRYAYRYEPRGYYPYYNSGYWKPARMMRKARPHYRLPKYHAAWGHTKCEYRHGMWHNKHHGRHRHHHW
jgi:hypothetical protein